jgi:hypothetical protein
MKIDNLEKQFIPYLEPIINQTLDMVDTLFLDIDNFDKNEILKMLNLLQEDFGDYIHMLSPETQGRILDIKYQIVEFDKIYDLQDTPSNTQPLEEFTRE